MLWRAQDFGESRVQLCYTGIESVGKSGPYSLYLAIVTVQPTPFISWDNLYFVHVVVMIISSPQVKGQGNKITRCPRRIKCTTLLYRYRSVGKSGPYSSYLPTVTVHPRPLHFMESSRLWGVTCATLLYRYRKCREIGSLQFISPHSYSPTHSLHFMGTISILFISLSW